MVTPCKMGWHVHKSNINREGKQRKNLVHVSSTLHFICTVLLSTHVHDAPESVYINETPRSAKARCDIFSSQ